MVVGEQELFSKIWNSSISMKELKLEQGKVFYVLIQLPLITLHHIYSVKPNSIMLCQVQWHTLRVQTQVGPT